MHSFPGEDIYFVGRDSHTPPFYSGMPYISSCISIYPQNRNQNENSFQLLKVVVELGRSFNDSSYAWPLFVCRSEEKENAHEERRILGELDRCNTELPKEEAADNNNSGRTASIVPEREPRTLDVFWFLKPCTLSSYS
ncbi:hypothetical protein RHGRI_001180 [Rhododendron griersonianum]|uniref:Uncharacterized protein n=1 Tax=Rhododendron griersonianum TaxID=479676 RepID=A0AAV6LJK7_9ERIC|nr:hypothetical protein RHGRI_001180 [Rhododendron griersonianum]